MNPLRYSEIYQETRIKVTQLLRDGLSPLLYYHNTEHTLDVMNAVEEIAGYEGIDDPGLLFKLRMASLFHDSGYLYTYENHEERSCEVMFRHLSPYGIDTEALEGIRDLILVTRNGSTPSNLPEQIICDADLDYLGRSDYREISARLKAELLEVGLLSDDREWQAKQIKFLETHQYYTKSSRQRRNPVKLQTLSRLKEQFEGKGDPA